MVYFIKLTITFSNIHCLSWASNNFNTTINKDNNYYSIIFKFKIYMISICIFFRNEEMKFYVK
jgi:hypothetical protein